MLFSELLQNNGWTFDLSSAIIGALAAFIVSVIIYNRRADLAKLKEKLLAPIVKLRSHAQSSQEEKYMHALQEALKGLLLFAPSNPQIIFQPPEFLAPAPLPTTIPQDGLLPKPLKISFPCLINGHRRILLSGPKASGRTTAMVMSVWQTAEKATEEKPYARFPVWVDLLQLKDLPEDDKSSALDKFANLAAQFMSNIHPKWLLEHLQNEETLIFVDNWDMLAKDTRTVVALWIAEIAAALPQSTWIIETEESGYGILTEAEFVPVTIVPATGDMTIFSLYKGWASLLNMESEEIQEEVLHALTECGLAGASLLEITLRIVVYLQTQQLPRRPVEVLDFFLDTRFPTLDLGEDQEEVADHARMLALSTLSYIAKTHRLEGRAFTRQEMFDYITTLLPPEEERPPKLEGAVRKLLNDSGLLRRRGKEWLPTHYIWEEFLTAWMLVDDEIGPDMAKTHLYDPSWVLLLEFYVGLRDATDMVNTLLRETATYGDRELLLRAARWSIVSPEDVAWHKIVMKALAQSFTAANITQDLRLHLGRDLALIAGESARAFYIKTLRHPKLAIRRAALRGLGWTATPREMGILAGALQDENLAIRQSATEAIADLGTAGAVRLLSEAIFEADEQISLAITEALARMPKGQDVLKEMANNADLLIRRAVAHGLGLIHEAWAGEILQTMAREDSEWLVRSAAESAIQELDDQLKNKSVVLSPPQIDQIDWLIAWAARQGQGLGVGEAALAMLNSTLTEGDSEAKILGAFTLSHLGRFEHIATLQTLLEDEDPIVSQAAEQAILQLERRYAVFQPH